MKPTKSRLRTLLAPAAIILLLTLGGCAAYVGDGPEWDGNVFFHDVHDAPRFGAFHDHGSNFSPGQRSFRGRSSMGSRAGGGAHAPSHTGGGHAPSGGAHASSGGGHKR